MNKPIEQDIWRIQTAHVRPSNHPARWHIPANEKVKQRRMVPDVTDDKIGILYHVWIIKTLTGPAVYLQNRAEVFV